MLAIFLTLLWNLINYSLTASIRGEVKDQDLVSTRGRIETGLKNVTPYLFTPADDLIGFGMLLFLVLTRTPSNTSKHPMFYLKKLLAFGIPSLLLKFPDVSNILQRLYTLQMSSKFKLLAFKIELKFNIFFLFSVYSKWSSSWFCFALTRNMKIGLPLSSLFATVFYKKVKDEYE